MTCSALSGYSQLIVNGKIVVRKDNSTGKLDVEGKDLLPHTWLPVFVNLRSLTSNTNLFFFHQDLCVMTSTLSDRLSKDNLLQFELIIKLSHVTMKV